MVTARIGRRRLPAGNFEQYAQYTGRSGRLPVEGIHRAVHFQRGFHRAGKMHAHYDVMCENYIPQAADREPHLGRDGGQPHFAGSDRLPESTGG